ncbi:MAG: nuclear transport factor 2 family protein [Luteimonas sp.]|nr:nuclear transport factor 2 family protein [Luteimonas sp.]
MAATMGPHAATTEQQVKAAAREFDAAQLHADRATLDRYLASGFVFVRGAGVVSDRDDFIRTFTSGTMKLDPFKVVKPVYIQFGPDHALVGGEVTLNGTSDGEAFSEHIRFADIFARRDGQWHVVYTQVTPIAVPSN